jgi:hypothetical protein
MNCLGELSCGLVHDELDELIYYLELSFFIQNANARALVYPVLFLD